MASSVRIECCEDESVATARTGYLTTQGFQVRRIDNARVTKAKPTTVSELPDTDWVFGPAPCPIVLVATAEE